MICWQHWQVVRIAKYITYIISNACVVSSEHLTRNTANSSSNNKIQCTIDLIMLGTKLLHCLFLCYVCLILLLQCITIITHLSSSNSRWS